MAQTSAAVQAVLGTNPNNAQIIQSFEPSQGTLQQWYVCGNGDAAGRCRLVTTTASDNAATQAAAILAALRA
jgi:hypothetical protein